jgi:squalene-hopene/tetraprenyl-beta-curcumene cyclase
MHTEIRPEIGSEIGSLRSRAEKASRLAQEFLFSVQRADRHWCGELESNPAITAQYVFLNQILARELGDKGARIKRYLLSLQNADGSWGIARKWEGDISTTTEVYLALRLLGLDRADPELLKAQRFILQNGGLEKTRSFTRIHLAMFGLVPWTSIPALPPEIIFLPAQSPVNIYALSSWARGTMVPLFLVCHHQPVFALPLEESLDHLWLDPTHKNIAYVAPWYRTLREHGWTTRTAWKSLFQASDRVLKGYENIHIGPLRERARARCVRWILEHQEESGDWAGIFPPMFYGLVALTLEGYHQKSEPVRRGLRAVDAFSWEDSQGFRIQACVSPVWDTALASIGLLDSGVDPRGKRMVGAIRWLLSKQVKADYGDWKVYRPELKGGGWSFEYDNSWYPDVDDTAAVLLALLKQDPGSASSEPVRLAVEWMLGMQNKDGGWAAFDVDNDKVFLNEIPFADVDALCDPSSPDIVGRVIEAFGVFLEHLPLGREYAGLRVRVIQANIRAFDYLRASQEKQGSWFGRWGVNYIYGTSNVLCGLARLGVPSTDASVAAAVRWLLTTQNADGGWGESVATYAHPRRMGEGESTPSQTAWALMGLLAFLPAEQPAIQRGIGSLLKNIRAAQDLPEHREVFQAGSPVPDAQGATWTEEHFTGTGFPRHFYLRYHLYAHYFPMMALGRFLHASSMGVGQGAMH